MAKATTKMELSEDELKAVLKKRLGGAPINRYSALNQDPTVSNLTSNIDKLEKTLAVQREALMLLRSHIAGKANATRKRRSK